MKNSKIIMEELPQDCDALCKKSEDNQSKMNNDKKTVFNGVVEAIETTLTKFFLLMDLEEQEKLLSITHC